MIPKFRVWDIDENEYADARRRTQLVLRPSGKVTEGSTTPNVIVEFSTGLRDKKRTAEFPEGQEIFQDDLYKDIDGLLFRVRMKCDGWGLFPVAPGTPVRSLYWHNICVKTWGEVIGNIHEHPELLKDEQNDS